MSTLAFINSVCSVIGIILIPITFVAWALAALFSSKVRELIRQRLFFHTVWFLAAFAPIFTLFIGIAHSGLRTARSVKTDNTINQIQTAIIGYRTEYGDPPAGTDSASLIKILTGDNPRKIEFLSLRPTDVNAKDEVLDAWGVPLRITMTNPEHPVIEDVGPEAKFVNADAMKFSKGDR